MDRSSVQAWLDRYSAAWKSYDAEEIRSLFAPEADYRYHPYDPDDEAVRGADAIMSDWLAEDRDDAGTYDSHYEPYAVEGDRAVAVGWSRYYTDGIEGEARARVPQRLPARVRRGGSLHALHGVLHGDAGTIPEPAS